MADLPLAQPGEIPDITAKLPELLPELRRITRSGWVQVVGVVLVALAVILAVQGLEEDGALGWSFAAGFIGFLGIGAIAARTRRRHQAEIMPLLAGAAGLTYTQDAMNFLTEFPERMLPQNLVRRCEDEISGKIGDRDIRFAEAKIETGGKNSRTMFKGVVVEFQNVAPMPAFFLASEAQTRGWFIFKGNIRVDDLVWLRGATGVSKVNYGVWGASEEAEKHPAFTQILNAILDLEGNVGGDLKLYTATSDGAKTWLALSHGRDLFRIGGLFANKDRVVVDIQRAYDDLTLPMRIVSALLATEAKAAKLLPKALTPA